MRKDLMIEKSLAHPAPQPTDKTSRELRGIAFAEEHFETIARSHRRGVYTVPSCTGEHTYTVTYTRRRESCSCPDWRRGNVCKHLFGVAIVKAKTGTCSGCGSRVRRRELVEVHGDNHDGLTWFGGESLCRECADKTGVCY